MPLKVNLHCHSSQSDGIQEPAALARMLARAGVHAAALTDHDTVEGLAAFQRAATAAGMRAIPGLELSAHDGGPVHLLAYGFRPEDPAIGQALALARKQSEGAALPVKEAITLIHQAGGRAFLAHPMLFPEGEEGLPARLARYKEWGLDGLEAVYSPYTEAQIRRLIDLARDFGLAVSGGSDYHGPHLPGLSDPGVHMPRDLWRGFRDLVLPSSGSAAGGEAVRPAPWPRAEPSRFLDWRSFLLRILLPTGLAIGLLLAPQFLYLRPAFEGALLARKREMIQELTRSAASILQECHEEELAGNASRAEAQREAVARIRHLRYGREGKDYFWITDRQPRMVMHPYRADLEGQDLTGYRDPKGVAVFVAATRLVEARQEGYLDYVWQWKDDPARMAPKHSYVRGFEPWGWIIGTGVYVDDVHAEIQAFTDRILRASLVVAAVVALLLLFVAQQGYRLERRRFQTEAALRDSRERFRTLVQASKEGTVLLLDGQLPFANRSFLEMAGCSEAQWNLLDLDEVLETSEPLDGLLDAARAGRPPVAPLQARLHARDGTRQEVLLTLEPVRIGARSGVSVSVRDLQGQREVRAALEDSRARFQAVAENLQVGIFRAELEPGLPLREANAFARRLLAPMDEPELPRLADALSHPDAAVALVADLRARGELHDRVLDLAQHLGGGQVSLSATLVRDEQGEPRYLDAVAEDVTARERETRERESLLADLQAAQLYLGEPVARFMREPRFVDAMMNVDRAAQTMARLDTDTLFVQGASGEALGILTDRDLRERVVAKGAAAPSTVHEIMSAPILTVPPSAQGHEALAILRDRRIGHLGVREPGGPVLGVLRTQDLLQVDRYPLAILIRSIREASRPDEVFDRRRRLPPLVTSLRESGARPRHVCRAISAVTDAVTEKLLAFACAQLGDPPGSWAYLALGSQGREEQTLLADQDHALVYQEPAGADPAALQAYFRKLGTTVSEWLALAGYPPCAGGMMASNPRWCQPLGQWKAQFREWVRRAEPQGRLEFATFLDLRRVAGDPALAAELRGLLRQEIAGEPSFLPLLAQDVIRYKPPKGLLGGLPHGHHPIDAKDAAAAIVNLARLYALQHGLPDTSTWERLRRLQERGVFSAAGHEELARAYDFLMDLRLGHQGERLLAGLPADNLIEPRALNQLDESLLKQVFSQVGTFQKKVQYDFLGGSAIQ